MAKGRDGVTDIHGIILGPSDFDPARRYPVIENAYAGPQDSHVPVAWRPSFGSMSQLAELGFVVVQADGMGTANRSKAFHDVCHKNLGDAGFPDRIASIRAAAATRPWIDLSRVGIYGGSAAREGREGFRVARHAGDRPRRRRNPLCVETPGGVSLSAAGNPHGAVTA